MVGYDSVADSHLAVIEPFDDDIFAERARLQPAPQLVRPPIQRQRPLDINGLIAPTMMFAIADGVADDTLGVDHDCTADRMLVDAGLVALPRQYFGSADADGQNFHGAIIPSAIPFLQHMS